MTTSNNFFSIKTIHLIIGTLLICNSVAEHYHSNSLFGKPPSSYKKNNFAYNYVFNHPYLSAISNIKMGEVSSKIKSHVSHAAIGMTLTSWVLNTMRPSKIKTPKYEVNVTKTSNIKTSEPKNPYKDKNNVIFTMEKGSEISGLTNYKLNLDSNTITNVFVQLQIQGIDKELEIGVCNSTYVAQDVDEINIEQGEIITIISKTGICWWNGVNSNGERGMFPAKNLVPINKKTIK